MSLVIRRLLATDFAAVQALRREALLQDPQSFASSVADDFIVNAQVPGPWLAPEGEQPLFGIWSEAALVGMAGLYRHAGARFRHKLQLWGMYVTPTMRGHGVASALLAVVIAAARGWPDALYLHLCVNAASHDAYTLYRRAGFNEWGVEPGGFRHDGILIDDRHLYLRLRDP